MRSLSRDPFARLNVVRRQDTGFTVDRTPTGDSFGERMYSCAWCDTVRYTPKGHPFTYRYGVSPDSGRDHFTLQGFCCKSCHDSYTA